MRIDLNIVVHRAQGEKVAYTIGGEHAKGHPGKNWINCPVFLDDRVSDLLLRVAEHITEEQVYAWYEVEPLNRDAFCNAVVLGLMRGAPRIRHDQLLTGLRCVCPEVDAPGRADKVYDFNGAFGVARDALEGGTLLSGLAFRYVEDVAFEAVVPVNPLAFSAVAAAPRVLRSLMDRILMDMHIADGGTVHLMTRSVAAATLPPEALALYFPEGAPPVLPPPVSSITPYAYAGLCKGLAEAPLSDLHFQKLYVSMHPYGQPRPFRLRRLFTEFQLDAACPLIKYRKSGEVLYRVNRDALAGLDADLVRFWSKESPHKLESVVFKIPYDDFFVTLIVFPLLVYHVKMTFRVRRATDLGYVSQAIAPKVNAVLGRIRDWAVFAAHEVTVPQLGPRMPVPLQAHLACTLQFDHRLPPMRVLEARLVSAGGVFVRAPRQDASAGNVCRLRYVRCSDYSPLVDIRQQLSSMVVSGSPRAATVDSVARTYNISREVVDRIMDSVKASGGDEEGGGGASRRMLSGILLELRRVSDFGLQVRAKGAQAEPALVVHAVRLVELLVKEGGLLVSPVARVQSSLREANSARIRQALKDEDALEGRDVGDEFEVSSEEVDTASDDDAGSEPGPDEDQDDDAPRNNAEDGATTGYTLARLKAADPDLFGYEAKNRNYKSFAANCAANTHRQPIAVTPEKLAEIDRRYPGAYTNRVAAGSTPERRKRNTYICPQVWCPVSEVAMTHAQLKAAGGCPGGPTEKPMVMGDKTKYVSFLDPSKHPSEMCVPCCFYANHLDAEGRLAARLRRCGGDEQLGGKQQNQDPSYVKGDTFPLEEGRYGRLPPIAARYFHAPPDLAKLAPERRTFVRKGIAHNSQHFLSCMAAVLRPPGVETAAQLVEHVARHLQPHEFIPLNGGGLVRMFAEDADPLSAPKGFAALKAWLARCGAYVRAYGMEGLAQRVAGAASLAALPEEDRACAQREHVVMTSLSNFVNFLHSAAPKDHELLLELFMSKLPWLNPMHLNVLIVEATPDGTLSAICPKYADYGRLVDTARPFALVLKYQQFYEPIVHASSTQVVEAFDASEDHRVRRLVDKARGFCTRTLSSQGDHVMAALVEFLAKRDPGPSTQALGPDLRPQALVTADGMYVPLPAGTRASARLRCCHLPEALDLLPRSTVPLPKVTRFFAGLRAKVSGFYEHKLAGTAELQVGPDLASVPLTRGQAAQALREYTVDLRILASGASVAPAKAWEVARQAERGEISKAYASVMAGGLDTRTEYEFLRAKENPFSYAMRHAKMAGLLRTAGVMGAGQRVVDALLLWDPALITGWTEESASDLLTQAEVDLGGLSSAPTAQAPRLLDDLLGEEAALRAGPQALLADGALKDVRPDAVARLLPGYGMATVSDMAAFIAAISKRAGSDLSEADARALLAEQDNAWHAVLRDVLSLDVYLFKDGGTWPQRVGDDAGARGVVMFEDDDGLHMLVKQDETRASVFRLKDFDVRGTRAFYHLLVDVQKQQR